MKRWIDTNPMMFLTYIIFFIAVVVGGVLVLIDASGRLQFDEYLQSISILGVGLGFLGGGRAVKNGLLHKEHTGGGVPGSVPEDAPSEAVLAAEYPGEPHASVFDDAGDLRAAELDKP